jgi:hypothetical protein
MLTASFFWRFSGLRWPNLIWQTSLVGDDSCGNGCGLLRSRWRIIYRVISLIDRLEWFGSCRRTNGWKSDDDEEEEEEHKIIAHILAQMKPVYQVGGLKDELGKNMCDRTVKIKGLVSWMDPDSQPTSQNPSNSTC